MTTGATINDADADTYIAQIRQRIARKLAELDETTEWSLDADEEGDEGVYADAEIPDESARVRELLSLVPAGTDRKFDHLLAVISHLRRKNENERFIIFTQYRETLEFLRIELARIFSEQKIATIKGGPLEDKIGAAERFWDDDGAKFLVSTSTGGEGINLQARAEEAIRLWTASRRTEMPEGTIVRYDLLGVSAAV